jgi:hypothetical protein
MSLSKYIQSPELLKNIPGKQPSELKSIIIDKGLQWYSENPDESKLIENNLSVLGIPSTAAFVDKIKLNIILHYYEKLLPLCGGAEFYSKFLKEHIDCSQALIQINQSMSESRGILLAIAHFGAVEFLTPSLAGYKLPLNTVLRFTTEQFSKIAHERAEELQKSGLFGSINFIEIGKPGTSIALEMAAALRRKQILVSVFDEKTEYSKPVTLLDKKVYGGAGLDRLIKFAGAPIDVYTAFMVRLENDQYKLQLEKIDLTSKDILKQMYNSLKAIVENNC